MTIKKIQLLVLIVSASLAMHSQSGTNWQLLWSEEFSGDTLNTAIWTYELGSSGWGNNELQNYTSSPQNISVQNGSLKITARNDNGQYSSARIITKDHFTFTYGKVEARIKLPQGQGLWPAFWMMGNNISQLSWPTCGEIDVMEHINNESMVHGSVHWNNNGHVWQTSSTQVDPQQYHLYGAIWSNDTISFYVDGIVYYNFSIVDNSNTLAFHNPFFLLLNMAVGGAWPGSPDNTTVFPAEMDVDFIRVYQKQIIGVNEQNENTVRISPNPFQDEVAFVDGPVNANLRVINALGQIVFETKTTSTVTHIETSAWPEGYYVVQVNDGTAIKSYKLIKAASALH